MIKAEEELDEELVWLIEAEDQGERIDKFITRQLPDNKSRTHVQQWLKAEHVMVNGKMAKSNYKLATGDQVSLHIPETVEVEIVPEDIPLNIVYEDTDMIVINKPRGLVVHPAPGHSSGTLVNALMYHCKDLAGINGELRPGIVHRIDKDTTGLLMVAKNDTALVSLAEQLKEHKVTRKYLAIVHGNIAHEHGTIDAPIGRDPYDRKLFTVTDHHGKASITHFAVLERFMNYTFVELKLETGRTHQIRVHMKFIGHPLVGDPAYGRSKGVPMKGQALHAAVLGYVHPRSGEYLEFNAPLPEDMKQLLSLIRDEYDNRS